MSNPLEGIGRAQDALGRAEKLLRGIGKPHTDANTMHVEIIVTFPDGEQSKFSTPIAVDDDEFKWSASKSGTGISIKGSTHRRTKA